MALLSLSLQAVYDDAGNRIMDALLYVYSAGTTTPAFTYNTPDYSGSRQPSPVPMRGNGTLPVVYVPPGSYRVRITDSTGKVIDQIEALQIDAPSGGGGDGGSFLPAQARETGDEFWRFGTGVRSGAVRENGRTIGSTASSATERANDDCHDLFVLLWNNDATLTVSGGRGPNAESDWSGGKTIALPDMRGRLQIALDDMGNSSAGRLNGGAFTVGNATTLGSYGGTAAQTLTVAQLPNFTVPVTASMDAQGTHQHSGGTTAVGDHVHALGYQRLVTAYGVGGVGAINTIGDENSPNSASNTRSAGGHSHTFVTDPNGLHAHNIFISVGSVGSGGAHSILQPFALRTLYIKL